MTPAEHEERGPGPRLRDLPIAALCPAIDLFFSGYFTGNSMETTFGTVLPHWPLVALLLLSGGLLAWRRTAPWPTFLAVLGFCLVAALSLVHFQPFVTVAVALHAVARRCPARRANPALVLVGFVALSDAWTATRLNEDSLFGLIVVTAAFQAFFTLVWALSRRDRTMRQRAEQERQQLLASAQESLGQQRQQIARDLHDILSHSMSAMILQSAGARAVSTKLDTTAESRQVSEALAAIESTGAESMRELHRLLGLLRTADEDGEHGIARLRLADIDALLTATRHGGLIVQHHREGTVQPLDPSVDLAAYHMVQESLTNAMKHAGRGAVVDIYETWEPEELHLQVRSAPGLPAADADSSPQGEAAAPARTLGSGTGLWGLRERVELAGGTFDSGAVDGGFVTSATLPVRGGGVA